MELEKGVKKETETAEKRIYFPELDGLRFFAFLFVFTHHRLQRGKIPELSYVHEYGWIGVDLFFVLSSFLLTKLLILEYQKNNTINIGKFYIRRIFRIWPLYIFVIVLSVLCFFYIQEKSLSDLPFLRLITLFTFTDNIASGLTDYNPMPFISPLWTISYEEQFYLIIPVAILLLVKLSNIKRLILFIVIFVLFNLVKLFLIKIQQPYLIRLLPVSHFESILFGVVIGFGGFDFISKHIRPFFLVVLSFLFVYLITLSTPVDVFSSGLIITYLLIGLSTSFFLLALLNSSYLKTFLSFQVLVFLGKRSYGLYVFHELGNILVNYVALYTKIPCSSPINTFFYSLFFTIIMAVLSYFLIETPFLKLKKRFEVVKSRPI